VHSLIPRTIAIFVCTRGASQWAFGSLTARALQDAAVATSGDYRHWIDVGGRRLSHTLDPKRGELLSISLASVTAVAATYTVADSWATTLMVRGSLERAEMACRNNLDALFIDWEAKHFRETRIGRLFESCSFFAQVA
jgi:thiamine biosynthesis lipoprotein